MSGRQRRLLAGLAVALIGGLLVAGILDDVRVQRQRHTSAGAAAGIRAAVLHDDERLRAATATSARDEADDVAATGHLAQVTAERTSADHLLDEAEKGVA
ncbi:MAG: hypothetical protein ACRDY1_15330, partial [Acidimicrobiales bacterium]